MRWPWHQHPTEGVVRGDAVRQGQEPGQPLVLAAAVERDVLEALRLAEHGADRDHQNVEQPVLDLPLAARVLDRLERGNQGFQHGLPPSGKAEPLAAHPVGIEPLISCVTPGQPAGDQEKELRARSVSFLWRQPWLRAKRSEGASAVRNGKARTRPAQGIGASSMTEIQRNPLALTKWPRLERTGSR